MQTQYFNAVTQKENGVRLAGSIIRSGGLVAFPTETVYGLGANGLDPAAVEGIFRAKGRPSDNPLILHVAKKSDVKDLWTRVPEEARLLMDAFWPGPLTLIFNRSSLVPDQVAARAAHRGGAHAGPQNRPGLDPGRRGAHCRPSANLSGRPSPTTAQHVKADLDGRIDLILDGGPCRVGLGIHGALPVRDAHHPAARRGHPGNAGGGHGQRPGFQRRARPPQGGWRRPLPGHEV